MKIKVTEKIDKKANDKIYEVGDEIDVIVSEFIDSDYLRYYRTEAGHKTMDFIPCDSVAIL